MEGKKKDMNDSEVFGIPSEFELQLYLFMHYPERVTISTTQLVM